MAVRLKAGAAPYADFGVFTPFGRKAGRANKYRAWMPQGDGTFLSKEMPGPGSLEAWKATWACFTTLMIKVQGCTESSLDIYAQNFTRLAALWPHPKVWHLLYEADDQLRCEGLDLIRRRTTAQPPYHRWRAPTRSAR